MSMSNDGEDVDSFRYGTALQYGFEVDHDEVVFKCTAAQLIAFAKACERAGRCQAATHAVLTAQNVSALGTETGEFGAAVLNSFAKSLDRVNDVADAELERFVTGATLQ
jgi:hypothetical protein